MNTVETWERIVNDMKNRYKSSEDAIAVAEKALEVAKRKSENV